MTEQPKRRRPAIVKGYGISTRQSGMLDWTWVDEQMAKSRNYWICSTRPDGRPHAAPVWGVWHEGALYFGSDPQSQKGRNITHNPEIVVHLESGDDTVILEGRVETSSDSARLAPVNQAYSAKYGMGGDAAAEYYILRPRRALAWHEHNYPESATRWDFGG